MMILLLGGGACSPAHEVNNQAEPQRWHSNDDQLFDSASAFRYLLTWVAAVAGLIPAAMQARITSLGLASGMVAAMARTISTGRMVVEDLGALPHRWASGGLEGQPGEGSRLDLPGKKHPAHPLG